MTMNSSQSQVVMSNSKNIFAKYLQYEIQLSSQNKIK